MDKKVNIYSYTVIDFGGNELTGTILAGSEAEARQSLEKRGLKVKNIELTGAQG